MLTVCRLQGTAVYGANHCGFQLHANLAGTILLTGHGRKNRQVADRVDNNGIDNVCGYKTFAHMAMSNSFKVMVIWLLCADMERGHTYYCFALTECLERWSDEETQGENRAIKA